MKIELDEKRKKKIITISAISATILIIVIVAVVVIVKNNNPKPIAQEFITESSVPIDTSVTTVPTTEETTEVTTTYPEFVNGLSEKAKEKVNQNSDTVGWIRISNTNIDYPITKTTDNDFYINHNFYKNPAAAGHTFMDFRNTFGEDEGGQSGDILIYGHNQADNTMFGCLRFYKNDTSFYEKNPIVEVSSLYRDYQYKIFSFIICDGSENTDFDYWNVINFPEEKDFNDFMTKVKAKQLIQTNVDVKYGDKILALSTCNSGSATDWNRFIVYARRVRPGEDAYEGTQGSVRIK